MRMASVDIKPGNVKIQVGSYIVNSDNVLGKGACGVVFTATDAKGNKMAAKRIDGKDKHKMQKITKDLDKLMTLDHPDIVKIFDIQQVDTTIWFFMEFCEFGDLNSFFCNHKLNEHQKLKLMGQIAQGVQYLHKNNIIHRDIKPANILIASGCPIVAKLTDFDFSKFLEPAYDTSLMTSNVGTPAFKAPEFYQRNEQGAINYHRNVDIFALGLTYLAMIQGNKNNLVPRIETPKDNSELHIPIGQLLAERIKYGTKPLDIFSRQNEVLLAEAFESMDIDGQADNLMVPNNIKDLIQRMTCIVPEERISAEEVVHNLNILARVCFPNCTILVNYMWCTWNFLLSSKYCMAYFYMV